MTADRHQAAALLGSSVEPTAACAAFLRRLSSQAFAPSLEDRAAIRVLVGRPALEPAGLGAAIAPNDDSRMAEIESFAERYWDLPTDVRRREWQDFHDKFAGDVVVAARLRRMESALDLPAIPEGDPPCRATALALFLQKQFVARPSNRALRRIEFRDKAAPLWEWVAAVGELRSRFPRHAAFDTLFLAELERRAYVGRNREPVRTPPRAPSAPAKGGVSTVLMAIFLAVTFVRGCATLLDRPANRYGAPETPFPRLDEKNWKVPDVPTKELSPSLKKLLEGIESRQRSEPKPEHAPTTPAEKEPRP